jgi:hypothetical protein
VDGTGGKRNGSILSDLEGGTLLNISKIDSPTNSRFKQFMKVSCVSDNISSENSPSSIVGWANNTELEITVGETYTVLAITKLFDVIFYYILSDASDEYPLSFPHYLFKVT